MKRWKNSWLTGALACAALAALGAAGSVLPLAQAAPAAEAKPADVARNADGEEIQALRKKKKLSPEELARLRLLEFKSGAATAARRGPESETLAGPPLSEREQVVHAVNRLSFGPAPGEVEHVVKEVGWQDWAKQQILEPEKIDNKALETEVAKRFPWTKMSLQQIREEYPYKDEYGNKALRSGVPQLVLYRAVNSKRQFEELMCEFWRNHFCVNIPDGKPLRSVTVADYEEKVVRAHVFGKFKNMLYASARHPAMLEYLDNYISRAGQWNENYARELMELHTLGADRYYKEVDVAELSKVLTGWTFDEKSLNFTFNAGWHQPGPKRVIGYTVPQGYEAGEQMLYALAVHKGTADFISEKLCRYLVNDNPPPALVKRVASTFKSTKGDLQKVYWEIVSSPEFMSRENYRSKFKTPFEFTVSALRATRAKLDSGEETARVLGKMGQSIYNCEDPTGYYDQAEAWMDSGVLTSRWEYAWRLVGGSVAGVQTSDGLLSKYSGLKPEEMTQKMADDVIGADVGDITRDAMRDAAGKGGAAQALSILLGSPDFQQQ